MRKVILAALLLLPCSFGSGVYTYEKSTTLSSAAETVTIHLPTGSNGTVKFLGASVYSSVATSFTLERDGSAPTATAVTPAEMNGGATGEARAYHTSNVGSSTTIKTYNVFAADEKRIDLPEKGLTAGQNLTIRTASMTGSVRIFIQWMER